MDLLSSLGIRIPCATPIMVSTCGIVHGDLIHSKLYLIYALQTVHVVSQIKINGLSPYIHTLKLRYLNV